MSAGDWRGGKAVSGPVPLMERKRNPEKPVDS